MLGHTHEIQTEGRLIRWPRFYDLFVKIATLGAEGRMRRRIVEAGQLRPDSRVLDVGCGTGTLAIAAAGLVGAAGTVSGIDPAAEMVAAAQAKAARHGLAVSFRVGAIEALDSGDRSVDVVFSTFMFHHLPPPLQTKGLAEIRRVLAPGGRLVLVDFGKPASVAELVRRSGLEPVRVEPGLLMFMMVAEAPRVR